MAGQQEPNILFLSCMKMFYSDIISDISGTHLQPESIPLLHPNVSKNPQPLLSDRNIHSPMTDLSSLGPKLGCEQDIAASQCEIFTLSSHQSMLSSISLLMDLAEEKINKSTSGQLYKWEGKEEKTS